MTKRQSAAGAASGIGQHGISVAWHGRQQAWRRLAWRITMSVSDG